MPTELTCHYCKKTFYSKSRCLRQRCCSKSCAGKEKQEKLGNGRTETRTCPICQTKFITKISSPKKYCDRSCVGTYRMQLPDVRRRVHNAATAKKISEKTKIRMSSPEGMLLRQKNSERMLRDNPMDDRKIVQKMLETKQKNGTLHEWKGERGGNGKFTKEEMILWNVLEKDGWEMPCVILTKEIATEDCYPHAYKADLGHRDHKVVIEVDGKSHRWKRNIIKDAKKTKALTKLGWRVVRFTNQEVTTDLSWVLSEIANVIKGS